MGVAGAAWAVPWAAPEAAPDAIAGVASPQPVVKAGHGCIEITIPGNEPRDVAVYTLTGTIVRKMRVAPGTTAVDVNAGYYIVRIDRLSTRVIVR